MRNGKIVIRPFQYNNETSDSNFKIANNIDDYKVLYGPNRLFVRNVYIDV